MTPSIYHHNKRKLSKILGRRIHHKHPWPCELDFVSCILFSFFFWVWFSLGSWSMCSSSLLFLYSMELVHDHPNYCWFLFVWGYFKMIRPPSYKCKVYGSNFPYFSFSSWAIHHTYFISREPIWFLDALSLWINSSWLLHFLNTWQYIS